MSAQFFRIFLFVVLAHGIALSVVWVGFPVPLARPAAMFFYAGSLPATESVVEGQEAFWRGQPQANQIPFDHFEASYFNRWIALRNPSKSPAAKASPLVTGIFKGRPRPEGI